VPIKPWFFLFSNDSNDNKALLPLVRNCGCLLFHPSPSEQKTRFVSRPKSFPLISNYFQPHVDWPCGRELDLNEFAGQIRAANAKLELRGSTNPPQNGQGGLRLEELTLVENEQMLYQLEQPFSVTIDRDRHVPDGRRSTWLLTLEPLRWRGPRSSLSVATQLTWPESGSFAIDAEHFDSAPLNAFLEEPLTPVTLDKARVEGGWTNGPIRFVATLGTLVSATKELPLQAHLVAEGDAQGVRISELEVRDQSSVVLTGHGAFPLRIEPGHAGNILQVDQQQGLELHVRTEPNTAFWNQIASWTRLRLSEPRLQLEIGGKLANPTGTVTAQFGAVDASKLWTNRPLPLLEDLRANLELSRTALWLRTLRVTVEGQPLGASGTLPLGTNDATGWRRFFEWQQATGVLQVAHAQIAPFARFLPKIISPQGVFALDLGVRTNLQWDGRLEISGAATRPLPSIGVMENLETKVKLHGRRVELQTLSGVLGGEPFAASGDVDFASRNAKIGMPLLELNLRGHGLPLARTPDLILRSDLDLKISSPTNAPALVSGAVRLGSPASQAATMTVRNGSHRLLRPSSDPAGRMAGFDAELDLSGTGSGAEDPAGGMAGSGPKPPDPAGTMAGFDSRVSRRYLATVSRLIPSSRAIRRWDQPLRLNVIIDCFKSILS
jgi:hypothetical protein